MFLYCVSHSRDSGLHTHRADSMWQCWRHWVSFHHRHHWTFAWKKPKNETKMAMNQEKTGYTFLQNYRKCDSTLQLHDQLFMKYGCIIPYSMEDSGPQDQLKNHRAIWYCTVISTREPAQPQHPPQRLRSRPLRCQPTMKPHSPASNLHMRLQRPFSPLTLMPQSFTEEPSLPPPVSAVDSAADSLLRQPLAQPPWSLTPSAALRGHKCCPGSGSSHPSMISVLHCPCCILRARKLLFVTFSPYFSFFSISHDSFYFQ
ncbi:ral guanine nucleotide dissociation stimulator [Tupaia chinensis]|uniref:ral guanine nucleotide dissociation stimulator n=1 Tax=Tupaia chinensis TaxID=246437 RepID=UPI0003C8EB2A|nr:ral guanine nucleotide dissociation stimulator [Tupaia chinensis]